MATCAVCDTEIARGEKFVLVGTEVVHRRKGCTLGIDRSRLTRTRMESARQSQRVNSLEGLVSSHAQKINDLTYDLHTVQQALRVAQTAAHQSQLALTNATSASYTRLDGLRAELRIMSAAVDRSEARIEELTAENARLRNGAAAETQEQPTDRDATEIRFSLLELDKP